MDHLEKPTAQEPIKGMTPAEISKQLPNGFHGAVIERVSVDYIARTAEWTMKLLVPDDSSPANRSRLRRGKFQVDGLGFVSLDVPDPHCDFATAGGLEIEGLLETTTKICGELDGLRAELDPLSFFHSFFVEELNGFIHFSGKQALFQWIED